MVNTWPPTRPGQGQDLSGNNGSFNNSFNNSTTSFSSPRKFGTQARRTFQSPTKEVDFEKEPRMALFETKAEIKYIPGGDDDAARMYGDRFQIKEEERTTKPKTSGYDFDALLKDVEIEHYPKR